MNSGIASIVIHRDSQFRITDPEQALKACLLNTGIKYSEVCDLGDDFYKIAFKKMSAGGKAFVVCAGGNTFNGKRRYVTIPSQATGIYIYNALMRLVTKAKDEHYACNEAEQNRQRRWADQLEKQKTIEKEWVNALHEARSKEHNDVAFVHLDNDELRKAYDMNEISVPLPEGNSAKAAFLSKLEDFLKANL